MTPRRALSLLASAAALVAVAPIGVAGAERDTSTAPCSSGDPTVRHRNAWTVVQPPKDLAGPITAHAAGGTDGRFLLVSDGRTVQRSADGGCSWTASYDAAADGIPGVGAVDGVTPKIGRLAFPGGSGQRALLALDGVAGVIGPKLLVSDDQGTTWTAGGSGLPGTGRIDQLIVPTETRNVYATLGFGESAAGADAAKIAGTLFGSEDGGATFAERSRGATILRVAVDPAKPGDVWVVRVGGAVERSTDGGRTFAAVNLPARGDADLAGENDQAWRDVVIAHEPGKSAVVALAAAPNVDATVSRILASIDGGKSFLDLPTEGVGADGGLTFGNSPSQLLMASASESTAFRGPGLLVFDLGEKRWREVDAEELISLRDGQVVPLDAARRGEGRSGLVLRQDPPPGTGDGKAPVLARYDLPDPPPGALVSKPSCVSGGIGDVAAGASAKDESDRPPVAAFNPERFEVGLAPGVEQRAPLNVTLSKVPSPLDVSFLIDSSDSMDPAIAGVRCSVERLVRDLRERRIDGWFGLGTYNDRVEYRYRRLVDVGPPSKLFTDALEDLRTILGREETMRSALFQTATGKGLVAGPDDDYVRSGKVLIEPGQQVGFRDEALKLVVVIGDEPYEPDTDYEPSVTETVESLNARGIKAIGIRVFPADIADTLQPSQKDQFLDRQLTLLRQMQEFARDTGAVAPPGGVDCDGGGSPDVAAGQPLVCTVTERGIRGRLGDTIASILDAQQDIRDVKLVPTETSGLAVRVEGGTLDQVNVRRRQELSGTAILSCTAEQAGKRYPVEFAVLAGKQRVGTVPGVATCGAIPAAVAPVVPRRESGKPKPAKAPAAAQQAQAPAAAPSTPAPPTPQAAAAAAPVPPPPAPVPVASGATANAVSSASAASSSASSAAAPSPGTGALAAAQESVVEQQLATVRTGDGEHAAVASRPAGLARRTSARTPGGAAAHETVPTPAIVTLGVGFVGAMAWLVLAGGPGGAGRGGGGVGRRAEVRVPTGSRRRRRDHRRG